MIKEKIIRCPHCKADLKKVGFRTAETAYMNYDWEWNKIKGYFEADDGEIDNSEINGAYCNKCDEEILDFVKDNGLL